MTDIRHAAQAALEALDQATRYGAGGFEDAKESLRAALAAQQAPGFTEMVPLEVYESAVRGRQEMRDALREEREKTKNLTRALGEAVNGPTFMGEPVIAQKAPQPVAPETIVGHSVERGGWCVYESTGGGEYACLSEPFPTKDEAEAARTNGILAGADHPAYQLGFADGVAQYAHRTRGQIREQSAQPVASTFADGIKAAAALVQRRRDDYTDCYGNTDPDTGAVEFPGNGDEYVGELDEIVDAIRAISAAAQPQQDADELGWLIEMQFGDGLLWWSGCFDDDGTYPPSRLIARMVNDVNKAVRFSRREDAQRVLDAMLAAQPCPLLARAKTLYSVHEHMWPEAAQPQQAEPSRSQKMRDAGFTPRDTRLECDECGQKVTAQFMPIHKCAQQAAQRVAPRPTHWMDDRGLHVTDKWLRSDAATSDYREAYNIPARITKNGVEALAAAQPQQARHRRAEMTDLTKAAQAALDALDNAIDHLPKPYSTGCSNAATDLRAALAAQQPCQYCNDTGDVHGLDGEWLGTCTACKWGSAQQPAQPVATIRECEACFTPDVGQLRGTCDHYSAEQVRVAAQSQQAPEARESLGWSAADESSFKEQR